MHKKSELGQIPFPSIKTACKENMCMCYVVALTHFQRVRSQEPDSDLVTKLGSGHIKPRMRLPLLLIHAVTVPHGNGMRLTVDGLNYSIRDCI